VTVTTSTFPTFRVMALPAGPRSLATSLPMATVRAVRAWPVASQQKARRNAMLACTSLTQRRMERQDVEDFLASLHPAPLHPASLHPAVSHG
jgi:hypothetical protein